MEWKPRLLLVEDESDVMQANRQYLTGQGYLVDCASTLREARSLLWEAPPDLILLDVMLPDGSGLEFCKEVRQATAAPIIFLTARGEDASIVGGLALGGDDYIVKPYSLEVMGARVAAQLRRRGRSHGQIDLPPLRIDLMTGRVWLGETQVELTRRELQMLVYLVENRGQVLSQAQIYEALWNAGPETMGNIVRIHVSRLRNKLGLDKADSCFELSATANQGYMFLRVSYPPGAE